MKTQKKLTCGLFTLSLQRKLGGDSIGIAYFAAEKNKEEKYGK